MANEFNVVNEKTGIDKEALNQFSEIKKTIAVMSGKGGVGKSSVTSLIAIALQEMGYKVGIMDADITGPSVPKVFGINKKRAVGTDLGVKPVETSSGIKVMSINLLLDDEEAPVVWRGPILGQTVKQFYTDVYWGELDFLLIDMPPGTGDVPLTVMQSIPMDGMIMVSSPQDLVKLIVKKSVNMAHKLDIKILGLVENMAGFRCPDCDAIHDVFGKSKVPMIAEEIGVNIITSIPIDPLMTELSDEGRLELYLKSQLEFDSYFKNCLKEIL